MSFPGFSLSGGLSSDAELDAELFQALCGVRSPAVRPSTELVRDARRVGVAGGRDHAVGRGVEAGEHRGDGNRSPVRSADRASKQDVFRGNRSRTGVVFRS